MRSELDHQASRTTTPSLEVRISALAESRLRSSPYCAVRGISCEYHDGVLTLRGRLSTYYHKQIAQELVAKIDGVREIANLIEVKYPAMRSRYLPQHQATAEIEESRAGFAEGME